MEYALPYVNVGTDLPRTIVHVQNTGGECTSAQLMIDAPGDLTRRKTCAIKLIAPGEAASFDLRDCEPTGSGSGIVYGSGPLAVTVDVFTPDVFSSYAAPPLDARRPDGHSLFDPGTAVAFAPLVYKNYRGWSTLFHLQSTGEPAFFKVTVLDLAGSPVAVRQVGPFALGERAELDLSAVGGIPFQFVGSARVEAFPAEDGPVATPWTPEPTATADGTADPTWTPRTPRWTVTPTSATATPSVTASRSPTARPEYAAYVPVALSP
jgi:hypothetical protein